MARASTKGRNRTSPAGFTLGSGLAAGESVQVRVGSPRWPTHGNPYFYIRVTVASRCVDLPHVLAGPGGVQTGYGTALASPCARAAPSWAAAPPHLLD